MAGCRRTGIPFDEYQEEDHPRLAKIALSCDSPANGRYIGSVLFVGLVSV